MNSPATSFVDANGRQLEVRRWESGASQISIVLIHEALGSVSYWKDFPEKLAALTGFNVVAYSRAGHGESEGPVEPRSVEYYQSQIDVVLPAVLNHFSIERPVLYGHSEGAAIAFLYAAGKPSVQAVIAECPILVQEERTVQTINELGASYATSDMSRRLGRYHRNADEVFYSWLQSTRGTVFKNFPMHAYLLRITCPVLALQGSHDEFGSIRQFQALQSAIPSAKHILLEAGHLLHREEPDLVVEYVQTFLKTALPAA